MKILAFDTTNDTASVAISEDQNILANIEELRPSMQAERLLPMIKEALEYSKLSYEDIDYLAVSSGPGSFTGIRIGLAAAKGLLLGTKIQGTVVSNFEVTHFRAMSQVKEYDKIIVILNAYRNQLYMQIFDRKNTIETLPLLIDYEDAVSLLEQESGKTICAGSGVGCIYHKIKFLPNLIILPRFTRVRAIYLCRYFSSLQSFKNLKPISPLYIRPSDAKQPTK